MATGQKPGCLEYLDFDGLEAIIQQSVDELASHLRQEAIDKANNSMFSVRVSLALAEPEPKGLE